jgi:hypothetical protein
MDFFNFQFSKIKIYLIIVHWHYVLQQLAILNLTQDEVDSSKSKYAIDLSQ